MMLGSQMLPLVIAAGAALIVLVIGIGLSGGNDGPSSRTVDKRLRRADGGEQLRRGPKGRAGVRRDTQLSEIPLVDMILRRIMPNPDKLRIRLERTGKAISISEFLLIVIATVMGVAILLKMFTPMDVVVAALAGLLVGLVVPLKIIRIIGNRRINKFMKEFPNAIDLIVRGLRSGLPFIESVNAVGREFPDPIGIEFRRIADSVKLGQSVEAAMWEVAERIDSAEYKFMIVAMSIQRETGGNLAETLSNLSDLLRKRKALHLKIRALSSEARASAYIIGSLPFVMAFIINIANHDYASMLWTDERGVRMSIRGCVIMFIGYYIMYRMVNFEF